MEWRQIDNTPYDVSACGQVRKGNRILKQHQRKEGHKYVNIVGLYKSPVVHVARLVLMAFNRVPVAGEHCRHLDGNPENNNIGNLAWGTQQENNADRATHGKSKGEKHFRSKLTEAAVLRILSGNERTKDLAKEFNVSTATISNARSGYSWSHLQNRKA